MEHKGIDIEKVYELVGRSGEGGMCVVNRGRRRSDGEIVAIKALKDHSASPEARERFMREAHLGAQLNHRNIVKVYEVGHFRGLPCIVMEFLEGTPLRDHMQIGIPLPWALNIMSQVSDAVAHAHESGMTHRDLKPENVIVLPDGHVKVVDWGLMRPTEETQGLTKTGMILGTPVYMAPEQITSAKGCPESDLYAIGVILFEMAARRPPYLGDTVQEVLAAKIRDDPPCLGDVNARAPAELAMLVDSLLVRDPEARPGPARMISMRLRKMSLELSEKTQSLPSDATMTMDMDLSATVDYGEDASGILDTTASKKLYAATAGRQGKELRSGLEEEPEIETSKESSPRQTGHRRPLQKTLKRSSPRALEAAVQKGDNRKSIILCFVTFLVGLGLGALLWHSSPEKGTTSAIKSEQSIDVQRVELEGFHGLILHLAKPVSQGLIELELLTTEGKRVISSKNELELRNIVEKKGVPQRIFKTRLPWTINRPRLLRVKNKEAESSIFLLDPANHLAEILNTVDSIAPSQLNRTLKDVARLRATMDAKQRGQKEAYSKMVKALDEIGVTASTGERLKRDLEELFEEEILPGSPLAVRLLPLRHIERVFMTRQAKELPPPWGLHVAGKLGFDFKLGQPDKRAGWRMIGELKTYERVKNKERWLWMGDCNFVEAQQKNLMGFSFTPIKEALKATGISGSSTIKPPEVENIVSSIYRQFTIKMPIHRHWPPKKLEATITTRLFLPEFVMSIRFNGGRPITVMNTIYYVMKPTTGFTYTSKYFVSFPVPVEDLREGMNTIFLEGILVPGTVVQSPTAIRDIRIWCPQD